MYLMFLTRPHPYVVSLLLVCLTEAISLVSMRVGGQPFIMDMQAAAAGDAANAFRFVPENVTLKATLILLALELVIVLLRVGYQSFCLHAARFQKTSFYDLMDGFIVFFRAILIWLITAVLVYFGTLALLVPGLILAYTYAMAPRLLLDHPDWGAFRCLSESRRLMRGHKKEFFLLRLGLFGWTLMCIFPVTRVFAEPYLTLSETVFYLDLIHDPVHKKEEEPPADEKPPWEN